MTGRSQPKHAGERLPTQARLDFDDNDLVRTLSGGHGENLKLVERRLGVSIGHRGTHLIVSGEASAVAFAERVLRQLFQLLKSGYRLHPEDVEQAIQVLANDATVSLADIFLDTVFVSSQRRAVAPRGLAQKRYVEAIRAHDIVIGIGPAGTGKTYLAMAMAAAALSERKVERVVLVRPAVEAGEKLGFLPGDIAAKVDPYLRPLYDALRDLVDADRASDLIERGTVEVAPLAFMRGRTLNDSFVILDEAQNTTPEQMKMFLTRLGYGSKAVVTGDVTQIDLPEGKTSGLVEARQVLAGVAGIAFCTFGEVDVVRHPLVQEVVRAYEAHDRKRKSKRAGVRGGEAPGPVLALPDVTDGK